MRKEDDRPEEIDREMLEQMRVDMARAVDTHDAKKFRRLLMQLGVDPESAIGKKRMAAFYRACNIDPH
jgi:hypothetical protein